MTNNNVFRLEKQFNYKGINCYYGFHRLGYRCCGVEVPRDKFTLSDNMIYVDNVARNPKEKITYFENDFGHLHNNYDIEGYFKVWEEDNNLREEMERWNKNNIGLKEIGTQELCEENCKNIVDELINKGIINYN